MRHRRATSPNSVESRNVYSTIRIDVATCVMYDDYSNVFKMWYAAGESYEPDVIAYAESADGIHWKKNKIPVMSSNADFLYQKAKVGACDVVRMKDGRYCMAYIAYQNINVARICLAYSDDGISNWIYSKSNPILSPERGKWDSHAVYKPSIVLDEENNEFLLWYNGRTNHCEQELFEKIQGALDFRLSNTTQCWQANLEAPTKKSEQREEFWNDYQEKGIDFVMKKYGTVPRQTRIKNKFLKILRGGVRTK